MAKYCTNKEIDRLVRSLLKSGWKFYNGGKHNRLVAPNGGRVTVPRSPSDHRAYRNLSKDIKGVLNPVCNL